MLGYTLLGRYTTFSGQVHPRTGTPPGQVHPAGQVNPPGRYLLAGTPTTPWAGTPHGHRTYVARYSQTDIITVCNTVWQGNVFTPVCHSFCSQGGACLSACWDTHPPAGTPPGQVHPQAGTPLGQVHPPKMVTAADVTHPTGTLSCSTRISRLLN